MARARTSAAPPRTALSRCAPPVDGRRDVAPRRAGGRRHAFARPSELGTMPSQADRACYANIIYAEDDIIS